MMWLVVGTWQGVSKADMDSNYNYCVYDSDIATGYGVGAFLFLLASQLLIMLASRCFCCGTPLKPGGSRACAVLLFIFCWYTFSLQLFPLTYYQYIYMLEKIEETAIVRHN